MLPVLLLAAAALATPMAADDVRAVVATARRAGGRVVVAARGAEAEKALERALSGVTPAIEVRRIATSVAVEREVGHLLAYQGATCVIAVAPVASRWDVRAAGACGDVTVDRIEVPGVAVVPSPSTPAATTPSRATLGPLGFSRVVFRIPPGAEVGHRRATPGGVPTVTWSWGSDLVASSDAVAVQVLDRLRTRGFNVRGGEDLVFGRDRAGEARFLLGGEVSGFSYENLVFFFTQHTKASITVAWQVFDPRLDKVVFSRTVNGTLDEDGTVLPESALTRTLLASLEVASEDPAFLTALVPSAPGAAPPSEPLPIPACKAPSRTLPADLPRVMEATVVLRRGSSTGAGVLVSPAGHVLTAAHVAGDGAGLEAVLPGGFAVPATLVRSDPGHDVALVTLPGRGTACLPLASDEPSVGASVYAVGAPLGEGPLSVSRGIVSGVRTDGGARFLQTDTSLNPGNSGGPLLDEHGVVLGIVSFKMVGEAVEGLGFGIPAPAASAALGLVIGEGR